MAGQNLNLTVALRALDRATGPLRSIDSQARRAGQAMRETTTQLNGLNATQRKIGQFRELKQGLTSTRSELAAARERTKALGRQLSQTANPSAALRREFEQSRRQLQRLGQEEQSQTRQLQQLRDGLRTAGVDTRQLADSERRLRQEIDRSNTRLEEQRRRLQQVARQQQSLNRARQQYQRTSALAGSMAATGAGGLATGSGILYAGARLLAPGLDFDASMSKVQALTRLSGDSPELAALREQARQLGASTQFTAGNAADAQGFLAMAGFNPQAIRAAMPGMLALAKAGDSELADTADIASNILTGFNLQAGDMGRVGDVLVGAFTRSNVNLQMLGETMKYVAPVAAGVGQDIETMAAMAGKLGDAGIQGSMGGTALRAIISRLAKPPKMAADALEQLGIKAADADGNLRDMPSILSELYDKTKALGSADQAGFFKAIAGEEAFSALQVLTQQAGNGELQKFIGTLRQANGEAEQTARVMGDNLRGDLKALGSAWEDLGIQISDQQNGPLRGITQGITKVIGSVKTWVAENPALASQLVKTAAGFGLVMAGMGGLTLAMASILGPFAMVRYGLSTMTIYGRGAFTVLTFLGRTALPLAGKALLFFGGALRAASTAALLLGKRLLLSTLAGMKAVAIGAFALGKVALIGLAKGLMVAGRAALFLGRAFLLNPIGLAITAIAGGAYLIYRNWDRIGPYFAGLWGEIKAGFSGGLSGIAATIINFSPLGLFHRVFAGVMGYFGVELPAKFTEFGGMIMQGLVKGIKNAAGAVKASVVGAASSAVDSFKSKLGIHSPSRVFAELGGYTMAGLSQGLEHSQGGPLQALGNISKRLTQAGAVSLALTTAPAIAGPLPEQVQPLRYAPAQLAPQQPTPLQQPVKQVLQGLTSEALPELVQRVRVELDLPNGMPTIGAPIPFDTRPPLAAAGAGSAPAITIGGDTLHITIGGGSGLDIASLRQMFNQLMDEQAAKKAARMRSALYDQE